MKKIHLSVILIPLLSSTLLAENPKPHYAVPKPIPQKVPTPHYAVPPKPKPYAVPPKPHQAVPKPIPQKVPTPHYAVPPKPKPYAVPPKPHQAVPKPIPQKVPTPHYAVPPKPKPYAVPKPMPQKVPKPYAVPPKPKPYAVPHLVPQAVPKPIPQKVPHMKPMAVPHLVPKVPHGLTIHKTQKPGKKYKGFKPHHATTPKQHHGSKPEVHHSKKPAINTHPALHPSKPVVHKSVHPVPKKHKTLHPKGKTAPVKQHTAVNPMADKVQVAPMGAKKPVHHKAKTSNTQQHRVGEKHSSRNNRDAKQFSNSYVTPKYIQDHSSNFIDQHDNIHYIYTDKGQTFIKVAVPYKKSGISQVGTTTKYLPVTISGKSVLYKGAPVHFMKSHTGFDTYEGQSIDQLQYTALHKGVTKPFGVPNKAPVPQPMKPSKHTKPSVAQKIPAPSTHAFSAVTKTGQVLGSTVPTPGIIVPYGPGKIPLTHAKKAAGGTMVNGVVTPTAVNVPKTPSPSKAPTPASHGASSLVLPTGASLTPPASGGYTKAGVMDKHGKTHIIYFPNSIGKHGAKTIGAGTSHTAVPNLAPATPPNKVPTLPKAPNMQPAIPAGVKQGTPTVNPAKLKAPKPSVQAIPTVFPTKPKGGNAQPMVHPTPSKPGYVNGVKQVTPMVHPTSNVQGTPTVKAKIGTVLHNQNGKPIGVIAAGPNGTKTLAPLAVPAAMPSQIPTVQKTPIATPYQKAHGTPMMHPTPNVQGTPMVHPTPSKPGYVNGVKQVTPTVNPAKLKAPKPSVQAIPTVFPTKPKGGNAQPMVHPTPSKPGYVNGVKQVTPMVHPTSNVQGTPTVKAKIGTVLHNQNGKPIGVIAAGPNGTKTLAPLAVPAAMPSQIPTVQKTPIATPYQKAHGTPMMHPTPNVQGTPMVHPTPSKPGYVNGVKQVTPTVNPAKLKAPKPSVQAIPTVFPTKPKGGNAQPMVHPTPSKPGYVNGVKQVTPMVHPTSNVQGTPTVKAKIGTVLHNQNGKPIGVIAAGPNGTKTLAPIAVPGVIPGGKPTIKAPVGTVVHAKNGSPIGTIVKLSNGQKALAPLAVPTAMPSQIPTVQKTPTATPYQKAHGTPMMHPTPSKPGYVNGVKQVTPTVNPAKLKAPKPSVQAIPTVFPTKPKGGNAQPMVHPTPSKPGYVNGVKQVTPMVHPTSNVQGTPTVKAKIGTVLHNKNGKPIGVIAAGPNGTKTLAPLAVPAAMPSQIPTVQKTPIATPYQKAHGTPMMHPTPNVQGTPMVHPTPSKPGYVNGVKQVTPMVHPQPSVQGTPTVKAKIGTVLHNQNGKPIGVIAAGPNGTKTLAPIAVPGVIPGGKPTIKAPVGTVVHAKNGAPIGTIVKLSNGQKALAPLVVPAAMPSQIPTVQKTPIATPYQKAHGTPMMHPTPNVQGTPMVHPTPSKPGYVNGVKQVTPMVHPKPSVQGTPNKVPQATPNATPMAVPGMVPTPKFPYKTPPLKQVSTTGAVTGSTAVSHGTQSEKAHTTSGEHAVSKSEKPGFFDRIKNFFRGNQDEIIEPGIRNKEVEAYRTNDAKEVTYRDTIKQDKKGDMQLKEHNMTAKHTK